VDTATHRPEVTQTDTWRDKKKTARQAAFPQPAGRFRWWWQVLGSNQRRLSRRFYRPLSSHSSNMPLTSTYTPRGGIPGRRRPSCVRAPGDSGKPARATDRRSAATDGGAGAVTLTVHPVPLPGGPVGGGQLRATWRRDPAGRQDASRRRTPAGPMASTADSSTPTPGRHPGDRRPPGPADLPGKPLA
jgi:hypothetical protein